MTTKWTKQDKDNGIYPAVGAIVKAVLGLHDEVEINVRGYSIDGKMAFGQCVKTGGAVICSVDWLHPVETAREKYEREKFHWVENQKIPPVPSAEAEAFYVAGLYYAYDQLYPFEEQ